MFAPLFHRSLHLFSVGRRFIWPEKAITSFIQHNRKIWKPWRVEGATSEILMDFYGVAETEVARSYFVNILARKHRAKIKSYSERMGNPTLHRIYGSFNVQSHIKVKLSKEQKNKVDLLFSEHFQQIQSKDQMIDFHLNGIWVGIDIYETYLRECSEPTLRLEDPRFQKVFRRGIELVVFWQDYFKSHKVAAVISSHDNYLPFNSVCKVAYLFKVPVYLPNPIYVCKVDKPFSTHRYFTAYRELFSRLSPEDRKNGMEWAERQLRRRIEGEVGVDMAYSTASSFGKELGHRVIRESEKTKVLICTHCFFDNPHAYERILFPDFLEWVQFLGRISERTDYDWYLKMHPDPLPGTIKVVQELLQRFPRIKEVPFNTPHPQLAREGIDCVLTVYGSVGMEYPLLGIPVLNAGYNPRAAYSFNLHMRSLQEYEETLLSLPEKLKEVKKPNLNELYEFYFMNYSYKYADDLVYQSYKDISNSLTPTERIGPAAYAYFLKNFDPKKHEQTIQRYSEFLDSESPFLFQFGPVAL